MAVLIVVVTCAAQSACRSSAKFESRNVRLAITRGALIYLPLWVAGPAGCFQQQNLEVTLEETQSAPKSAQALLGGSVDVAAGGYLQVLDLARQGRTVQSFVLLQKQPGIAVVVSPRSSRRVRDVPDMKGLNVGISSPGSDAHKILVHMLRQHGMGPQDVNFIGVGSAVAHASALEQGLIDVGMALGLTIPYLQSRHPSLQVVFDTRTPEGTKAALGVSEFPNSVLVTTSDWLEENPEIARLLAAAVLCGLRWVSTHSPEQIREALPDSCRSQLVAADLEAIASTQRMMSKDGRMSPEMHQAALRVVGANEQEVRDTYTNEYLPQ